MKLVTDKSHRDFYYKNGWIEFDDLLTSKQVSEVQGLMEQVLAKRLGVSQHRIKETNREDLFSAGHDLWRENETLKKYFLSKQFAEIAGELNEQHSLRMGSDQLIIGENRAALLGKEKPYEKYLLQINTLEDKSCFRPVAGGLLICLDPTTVESDSPIFSSESGRGVFFKKDIELDFSVLKESLSGRYILITYVEPKTVYVLNENDPHTHTIKHMGYVFGDRLNDNLHPLIFR